VQLGDRQLWLFTRALFRKAPGGVREEWE